MNGRNQSEKIAVRRKEGFVGIDFRKGTWQVTAVVEGEEVFHARIAIAWLFFLGFLYILDNPHRLYGHVVPPP